LVGGCGRTFRRFAGILLGEDDFELEQAAFPDGLVFAGDGAVPFAQVEGAVLGARGLGDEAEGV
jgi:hypothetical protein